MAGNTITQRITLEGGDTIKLQLENIGKAGETAFKRLHDAAQSSQSLQSFAPILDAVKEKAAALGVAGRQLGNDFSTLGERVGTSARNIGLLGVAVAAAAVGFVALVKGAASSADEAQKAAEAVGLSVKAFKQFSFAANQSGVDTEHFEKGMNHFNNSLDEVTKTEIEFGKKQAALTRELSLGRISTEGYFNAMEELNFQASQNVNVYTRLGIVISKNADGTKDSARTLLDIADAFSALPTGAEKSAIAMDLFGAKNSRMANFVNQGSKGIQKFNAELARLAPPLTEAQNLIGEKLTQAFGKLDRVVGSTKNAILLAFAPSMTNLVNQFVELIAQSRFRMVEFAKTVADYVTPIVNDLIAILDGRPEDVKNGFMIQARDDMMAFATAAQKAVTEMIIPALQALLAVLEGVATAINAVFGTEISGKQIAIALVITRMIGLFGLLKIAVVIVAHAIAGLVAVFGGPMVALAALGFAIGALIVTSVGGLPGIKEAWNNAWTSISGFVKGAVIKIAESMGITKQDVQNTIDFLAFTWSTLPGLIGGFFASIPGRIKVAWDKAVKQAQEFGDWLVALFDEKVTAIKQFFLDLPTDVQKMFSDFVDSVVALWDRLVEKTVELGAALIAPFKSAIDSIAGFFQSLWNDVVSTFDKIIAKAREVVAAVSDVGASSSALDSSAGPGFAGGGPVRGPGTSRSDSIWARLSNFEYVHTAKATKYYGLAFMDAINKMRIPVASIQQLMGGGFSTGGFAGSLGNLMPRTRFADGGLAFAGATGGGSGLQPVHFHINGQDFPAMASLDVVKRIQNYATASQLRSGGRKPTWYEG